MLRLCIRFFALTVFTVSLIAGFTLTTYAQSHVSNTSNKGSKQDKPKYGGACNNLEVTLNETVKPDVNCRDNDVNLKIGVVDCPTGIELNWDSNGNGANICFKGKGTANLTDYCAPLNYGGCLAGTWNDKASSYASRIHTVLWTKQELTPKVQSLCSYASRIHTVLWTDTNRGGSGYELFSNQSGNLTGIWNDAFSSVQIY